MQNFDSIQLSKLFYTNKYDFFIIVILKGEKDLQNIKANIKIHKIIILFYQ